MFVSLSWDEDVEKVIDLLELQKGRKIGKNVSVKFSDKLSSGCLPSLFIKEMAADRCQTI